MKEEIKEKIWNNIRNVIRGYEITCEEDIYQASRIQDNTVDVLCEILSPLLDELEKIVIEKTGDNNFDIEKLLEK